jgi:hypothetical protein
VASFLAPLRIRLDDADDLVLVGQFAKGGPLGGGVIVSDADLAHLDPLSGLTGSPCSRLQPGYRHGEGTCADGAGQEMSSIVAVHFACSSV